MRWPFREERSLFPSLFFPLLNLMEITERVPPFPELNDCAFSPLLDPSWQRIKGCEFPSPSSFSPFFFFWHGAKGYIAGPSL